MYMGPSPTFIGFIYFGFMSNTSMCWIKSQVQLKHYRYSHICTYILDEKLGSYSYFQINTVKTDLLNIQVKLFKTTI